jgi:hypothetical protein
MDISVIVPFRDREIARVKNLVASIRAQHATSPEIIVSDYGSVPEFRDALVTLQSELGIRVVRSESGGFPWSRAHSINNGARASTYEHVAVVDVDMTFMDPILDHCVEMASPDKVIFCESIWLQSPTQHYSRGLRHRSPGVFQFIRKYWFSKLEGFDEAIEFWGGEDNDWKRRLSIAGVQPVWLHGDTERLVHTWHASEGTILARPPSAAWGTLRRQILNTHGGPKNPDWGRCISIEERPLLRRSSQSADETLSIPPGSFLDKLPEIAQKLADGKTLALEIGPRISPRKLQKFGPLLLRLSTLFEKFALELAPAINNNLDVFLIVRSAWKGILRDYYITPDLKTVTVMGASK